MSCSEPSPSSPKNAIDKEFNYDFDPVLIEDERQFYLKAFPHIEQVRERRTHCTVCRIHLGTAPLQQPNIKMHPILRVTLCAKCFDFYNTGEFSKGEDGSELYCRWCGQGGEVYCCSKCPFVFCKSCIVKNLDRGVVADIEKNENWNCFRCSPKILWPLRAQHWAHILYIAQQRKDILAQNLSEEELKQRMSIDNCTCCRLAKSRASNLSGSMESLGSSSSRTSETKGKSRKTKPETKSTTATTAKRAKENNDEVVCTPDLQSMLEPDCQLTTGAAPVPQTTPPPLVLRNSTIQIRSVPGSFPTSSSPVYHVVNGFRIDLNSAAQKGIYTLPNGRMIQVKRTGVPGVSTSHSTTNNNVVWSRPCNMRPVLSMQQQQQLQQQQRNSPQFNSTLQANVNNLSTPSNQDLKPPLLKRYAFPETPLGQARSGLQDKIISAQLIYQHFNNKLTTFCNSNAYKQARNYNDVKDLYITLSYMCKYTMGRMQGLENEILEDMRQLGFGSIATSLKNGQYGTGFQNKKEEQNNDEIEIIEPKTDTITIDSDDENTNCSKPKQFKLLNNQKVIPIKKKTISVHHGLSTPYSRINMGTRPGEILKVLQTPIIKPTPPPPPAPAPALVSISNPNTIQIQNPTPLNILQKPITATLNNSDNLSENDVMLATQSILASMLEVEINEDENETESVAKRQQPRKQPRKRTTTTNKGNRGKMCIIAPERQEYLKKYDKKLKSKCDVKLTRVDEDPKYAKYFANQRKNNLEENEVIINNYNIEENEVEIIIDSEQDSPIEQNEVTIINDPIPESESYYQETLPTTLDIENIMPANIIHVPHEVENIAENKNIDEKTAESTANKENQQNTNMEMHEPNKTVTSDCKEVSEKESEKILAKPITNDEVTENSNCQTIDENFTESATAMETEVDAASIMSNDFNENNTLDLQSNITECHNELKLHPPNELNSLPSIVNNGMNEHLNEHTYSSPML